MKKVPTQAMQTHLDKKKAKTEERNRKLVEGTGCTYQRTERVGKRMVVFYLCNCPGEKHQMSRQYTSFARSVEETGSFCDVQAKEANSRSNTIAHNKQEVKDKIAATCMEIYGAKTNLMTEAHKKYTKEKCATENNGATNYSQVPAVKEKKKATCMKNSGVDSPFKDPIAREKGRQTMIKKFGVDNPSKCEEIKKKKKETWKQTLGVENPMQSKEVQDKFKTTMLERHGVEFPSQMEDHVQKTEATNMKNYGVRHPQQNTEMRIAYCKNNYDIYDFEEYGIEKKFVCDGFEPHAIKKLLEEEVLEDEILTETEILESGEFKPFLYINEKGLECRYYPDIYDRKNKRFIEVKGSGDESKYSEKIRRKMNAIKSQGFEIVMWVFDKNGKFIRQIECKDI